MQSLVGDVSPAEVQDFQTLDSAALDQVDESTLLELASQE
jgi:hypothetical protein